MRRAQVPHRSLRRGGRSLRRRGRRWRQPERRRRRRRERGAVADGDRLFATPRAARRACRFFPWRPSDACDPPASTPSDLSPRTRGQTRAGATSDRAPPWSRAAGARRRVGAEVPVGRAGTIDCRGPRGRRKWPISSGLGAVSSRCRRRVGRAHRVTVGAGVPNCSLCERGKNVRLSLLPNRFPGHSARLQVSIHVRAWREEVAPLGNENTSKTWIKATGVGRVPEDDLPNGATEHGGHPGTSGATPMAVAYWPRI